MMIPMGKKSRRPNRRNRHEPKQNQSGLTVTVGVSPSVYSNNQPSLRKELQLVRSSLLYADRVDLVAPTVGWMRTLTPLLGVNPDDPWRSIADLPPETLERLGVRDITPEQFSAAMRIMADDTDPESLEAGRQWKEAIRTMKQLATEVAGSDDSLELDMALDAGSVTLVSEGTRFEDNTEQQIEWFRERLTEALTDPGATVLLDDVTNEFLRESGRYADGLPKVADSRSRRAAIGAGLVERLPVFPNSPMSDILEAREDLAEGRSEYRESVKELSNKLQSAALDSTLPSEIDELWYDSVRPKLKKLQKSTMKTRLMHGTGMRLIDEIQSLPSILVAVVGLGEMADALPDLMTAGAATGRVAAAGAKEALQARSAVRDHDLVYLLDINKKLGNAPIQ